MIVLLYYNVKPLTRVETKYNSAACLLFSSSSMQAMSVASCGHGSSHNSVHSVHSPLHSSQPSHSLHSSYSSYLSHHLINSVIYLVQPSHLIHLTHAGHNKVAPKARQACVAALGSLGQALGAGQTKANECVLCCIE